MKPPIDRKPYDYNLGLAGVTVADDWKCVDIGCGTDFWPRANMYVDINPAAIKERSPAKLADLNQVLPFRDKEFDFAYCAHLLEHVEDPLHAAAEISRIAKAGIVECPHPFKESLFLFHEDDHRWLVWPPAERGGALRFMRFDHERAAKLRDPEVSKVMHRLWRLGPATLEHDSMLARRWYHDHEPHLNTIHAWEGTLEVEIL